MEITNLSHVEEDDRGKASSNALLCGDSDDKQPDWQLWRLAQKFLWGSYVGIEKWQRLEVYEDAIRSGSEHQDALTQAIEWPVEDLPEIVFEAVKAEPYPSKGECDQMLAEAR